MSIEPNQTQEEEGFSLGTDLTQGGQFGLDQGQNGGVVVNFPGGQGAPDPAEGRLAQPQQPVAPQQGAPQPAATPPDPNQIDWSQPFDVERLPDNLKAVGGYVKQLQASHQNAMSQAANLQQQYQRQLEIQNQNNLVAQQQNQNIQALAQQNAQPSNQPKVFDPNAVAGQYGYAPGQPGFDEAQQVIGMARAVATDSEERMTAQINPLVESVQKIQETLNTLGQGVQGIQQHQQENIAQGYQQEMNEVKKKYPNDFINGVVPDQVISNFAPYVGKLNPATNQPHTIMTAYEYATGKAHAMSNAMQNNQQQLINTNQQLAAPMGAATTTQPQVTLAEGDQAGLITALRQMGWE